MKTKEIKTNAMRLLDKSKIPYESISYSAENGTDGKSVAKSLSISEEILFKTLVTQGKSGSHFVFIIPVSRELDLKKAAKSVCEKSIVMLPQKNLFSLTGYVHGGCSPLSMKKIFPTVFHETANTYKYIYFNAGKIGLQIKCNANDIQSILPMIFADIVS